MKVTDKIMNQDCIDIFLDGEIEEEDFDMPECPKCGSDAVGYDGSDGFFECFQCDHVWIG